MATQATNPKIEELRFRVKTDPKSRLFYQLAEELRKVKSFDEAEQVLRAGLTHNATYLAAWVSLGRTLREEGKHQDAIDAFTTALQLDPGNVVAARQMADAYLALGDKIEAIKKYKLVRALLPVDEVLNATIDRLEDELNPITIHPASAAPPAEEAVPAPFTPDDTQPFRDAAAALRNEAEIARQTSDDQPMRAAHEESPFEEPAETYTADAVDVEQPLGMHVEPSPMTAEMPLPWPEEQPAAQPFAPVSEVAAPAAADDDAANTVTMADLYVQQGHLDRAQSIYESILDRDPNNDSVRAKLDALEALPRSGSAASSKDPKVVKLEQWLTRIKAGEGGRV